MAEDLTDKLKEIQKKLKTPPSLSSVESDKITETFEAMKGILDDTLVVVLEKDRAEAFRYTNLLVQALQQADTNFIGGVPPTPDVEPRPAADVEPQPAEPVVQSTAEGSTTEGLQIRADSPKGPVNKPDFLEFSKSLTPHQMNIASRLDCFKQFPEVGDAIVCTDCTMEKMIACIRLEDPTVDPNDDFKLDVEMMREKGNNS